MKNHSTNSERTTHTNSSVVFEYSDEQGEIFEGDEELIDTGYTVKYYYLTSSGTSAAGTVSLDGGAVDQAL